MSFNTFKANNPNIKTYFAFSEIAFFPFYLVFKNGSTPHENELKFPF